jgi:hypothetical protein
MTRYTCLIMLTPLAATVVVAVGCVADQPASCNTDAATQCAVVVAQGNGSVTCGLGTTSCVDGGWGACNVGSYQQRAWEGVAYPVAEGQALGASQPCADPCDIYCNGFTDDPAGVALGPGLTTDPGTGGITLSF